jgi:CTP synthase
LFASVEEKCVISCHDAPSIYKVPEVLESQGTLKAIAERLSLGRSTSKWGNWKAIADSFSNYKGSVKIAVVGKYVTLPDSYVSVYHALSHAGAGIGRKVEIQWIDSEQFENGGERNISTLGGFDGILVPGGFGKRGSEGIIVAFARNVCNLSGANSTELEPHTKNPIIDFMPEQRTIHDMGGTMRLGSHEISVSSGTRAAKVYGSTLIKRRHRHRYEFNQHYLDLISKAGLVLSAHSDSRKRMEILEIPGHRFYFAVQYHAEFSSRPGRPEESFDAFVRAAARVKI